MLYGDADFGSDEVYEVPSLRQSNLERNCGQIFARGPALTKDFLEKMNVDIVPERTYLFGRVLNTKKILFISGLSLLHLISIIGVIIMWLTDFFDNTMLSTLAISNTSEHFEMWHTPSPKVTVNVYIFNYTNVEEYESKMQKKLQVQEVGPYVYEESLEKVNIVFHEDDTVSYQEKRTYKFLPHLSKGKQSDRVTVPNIPLLGGAAKTKFKNYWERLAFSGLLTAMDQKPFLTLAADSFITGYSSDFYDVSRTMAKMNNEKFPEKVGVFSRKAGVQPNVFTVNTGKRDISRLGVIEKVDNETIFKYWSTDECNSLEGADGAVFPPKLVQHKQPLSFVFLPMCRTVPFLFEKEIDILDGKIPAYRYAVPEHIYDSVEENPQHQCYCNMDTGVCPLKGVFNVAPCNMGAPIFVSNPHFYNADRSLVNGVSGLSTAKRDISTYLNIHPVMGFAMSGITRVQMNVQVQKSSTVYQLDRYNDGLMLPFAWLEASVDDKTLPQDFVDIIYEATFTLKGVKLAFQWGFLLTMFITLVCIALVCRYRWQNAFSNRNSLRPLERRHENENIQEI